MHKSSVRTIGSQFTAAIVGIVATAVVMGGGLAFAQEAPQTGVAVAETLAGPNTVNSAAIINGSVTGQDIATATVGRGGIKPGVAPLYAKVDADASSATLLSGKGVTGVEFLTAGFYSVTFSRSVVGCGWLATLNDNDAGASSPGEISIDRNTPGDLFTLRIKTYNSAGASAAPAGDDGFTVMITC